MTGLTLLTWWVVASSPPARWSALTPDERATVLRELSAKPLRARVLEASERFLGTPYVFSPLGEGHGKDADPRVRYDAADCLSLVEETIALALTPSPAEFEPTLARVRYRAEPTYEDRNHVMEAQWIPNNLAKGFIQDVTATYGGADAVTVSKTYTDASWTSESAAGLDLPAGRHLTGTFRVPMIPIRRFLAHAGSIPSGTVVVVVRKDEPDLITRISHLGILVQEKRGPVLRHASSVGKREVLDEPLQSFVSRHAGLTKWPVEGFALYAISRPPEPAHQDLDAGRGF